MGTARQIPKRALSFSIPVSGKQLTERPERRHTKKQITMTGERAASLPEERKRNEEEEKSGSETGSFIYDYIDYPDYPDEPVFVL